MNQFSSKQSETGKVRVSSDIKSSAAIFESLASPWFEKESVGTYVSDRFRAKKVQLFPQDTLTLLEQFKVMNPELYYGLVKYIDGGYIQQPSSVDDLPALSGIPKSQHKSFSMVFQQHADLFLAKADEEILDKYRSVLKNRICSFETPLHTLDFLLQVVVLSLNDGDSGEWKDFLSSIRHSTSELTIADQYMFSNNSPDILSFIHGVRVQSRNRIEVKLLTRKDDSIKDYKHRIMDLKAKLGDCRVDLFLFGSASSKLIHDREVVTDSVYVTMGSGLDTIRNGKVVKSSIITSIGRFSDLKSIYEEKLTRLIGLQSSNACVEKFTTD